MQAFQWTAYIKSWKFREVCLLCIPLIYIYPEHEYIMNVLKGILFLYGRLYVWSKPSKILQTVVVGNILRIVEQHYPLTAKAFKNQIYECVKSIFVDSNFVLHLCTI